MIPVSCENIWPLGDLRNWLLQRGEALIMLQKSFGLLTANLIYTILTNFSGKEEQTVKCSNPKQTPVHCALLHGVKTPPKVRKS